MSTSRKALLLPQAFAPAPIEFKIEPDDLSELYRGLPPEYALEGLRGTISSVVVSGVVVEEEFTAQEKPLLDCFNNQCDALIGSIRKSCNTLHINERFLANLSLFSNRFQSRKYYGKQSPKFYTEIKKSLEIIAIYLLRSVSKSSNNSKAKRIMDDLLKNIAYCGPGIFNHINSAKLEVLCPDTTEAWLAQLRRTLITQIAHQYLKKENISENLITHVENVFLQYASKQGWNPYDGESLQAVNEIHAGLARVTAEGRIFFRNTFFKEYTPKAIMRELAMRFTLSLQERVKKHTEEQHIVGDIAFNDFLDFQNFFAGLPIIPEKGGVYVLFDPELDSEDENSEEKHDKRTVVADNDSLSIVLYGYRLHLKSIPALMLSLMNYYRKKGTPFFQTYQDELKSMTLVYNLPELSYKHPSESDGAPLPLDDKTVLPVELSVLQAFKIPLFNAQFHCYYNTGKDKNFSEYTFIDVDFTKVDITQLNLKDAKFSKPKFTSDQYWYLYHTYFLRQMSDEQQRAYFRKSGMAVLYNAAEYGNAEIICLLFEMGFNVKPGMTPLHYAAQHNSAEATRLLLSVGANPRALNDNRNTPMLLAAQKNHWNCVEVFIEAQKNKDNYATVLLYAAKANRLDVVQKLLRNMQGKYDLSCYLSGMTVLHYAVRNGNQEMVRVLLDAGAKLYWKDIDGNTPLHIAAQNGNAEMVDFLLKTGANPCFINNNERTPIWVAAKAGRWECVKKFIETGRNTYSYSPVLLYATNADQVDIVLMLLETNFNVRFCFSDTWKTALHCAANHGNVPVVSALLKKGADPTSQDATLRTALHDAAQHGHTEVARLLLDAASADSDSRRWHESTAIKLAAENGHWDCVRLFLEKQRGGSGYASVLVDAAKANHLDVVKNILNTKDEAGNYFNARERKTALHYAAQHGNTEMVDLLLKKSADPHLVDKNQNRPIDLAIERGHWDCVELLAQFVHEREHAETIRILIETGKNLKNNPRKFKIYVSLIRYFVRNSWWDSWTSQPASERRLNDMRTLLKILQDSEEEIFLEKIRKYCVTEIKTSSIFNNSALRDGVLEAVSICADTDLLSAAQANKLEIVEKLLQVNNGICFRKIDGMTALHYAAKNGNAVMIGALLKAGANLTLRDTNKFTPMGLAAKEGHWDCVELFLNTEKDTEYNVVLWHAANTNNLEFARKSLLLMDQKMVDSYDRGTLKTALHRAAQNGNAEMVSVLLNAGANPSLNDHNERMPIQLAIQGGHWDCVQKLALFVHRDKHADVIDDFIRIGKKLENNENNENNENDKKLKIYGALISYFAGNPLSVSWTSEATSERRLENIKALLKILEEDNQEDGLEEKVEHYCITQIKTWGRVSFFNRSALRAGVLDACSRAASFRLAAM